MKVKGETKSDSTKRRLTRRVGTAHQIPFWVYLPLFPEIAIISLVKANTAPHIIVDVSFVPCSWTAGIVQYKYSAHERFLCFALRNALPFCIWCYGCTRGVSEGVREVGTESSIGTALKQKQKSLCWRVIQEFLVRDQDPGDCRQRGR